MSGWRDLLFGGGSEGKREPARAPRSAPVRAEPQDRTAPVERSRGRNAAGARERPRPGDTALGTRSAGGLHGFPPSSVAAPVPHPTTNTASRASFGWAPPAPAAPARAERAPAVRAEDFPPGPRRRLVLVDLGDLRARVRGYDVTDAAPVAIGRAEIESAVCQGALPDRAGAERGLRATSGEVVEPPVVVGHPGGPIAQDPWLAVGKAAASLVGYEATLAANPDDERIETLLTALVFPMVRDGDDVDLLCVDGPNGAQAGLERVLRRWHGAQRTLRGFCPGAGEVSERRVRFATERVPAGQALLELAYERGLVVEGGAPVVFGDLGHRNSRLYVMDFDSGLLDLDVIPHGGASFLEHARRYAEERRWRPGGDMDLLRQLEAGTDMLSFGGMSFVTRQFFENPREDLVKAIVACMAQRLRRLVEQAGRWPEAMFLTGGPARALCSEIQERLAARGLPLGSVEPLFARPSPFLEGAFCSYRFSRRIRAA